MTVEPFLAEGKLTRDNGMHWMVVPKLLAATSVTSFVGAWREAKWLAE